MGYGILQNVHVDLIHLKKKVLHSQQKKRSTPPPTEKKNKKTLGSKPVTPLGIKWDAPNALGSKQVNTF